MRLISSLTLTRLSFLSWPDEQVFGSLVRGTLRCNPHLVEYASPLAHAVRAAEKEWGPEEEEEEEEEYMD